MTEERAPLPTGKAGARRAWLRVHASPLVWPRPGARAGGTSLAAIWAWSPWFGLVVGTFTVMAAYTDAASGVGARYFDLFWLGMLAFVVPSFLRLCAAGATRSERLAILVALGLFDYLPKYLRDPQYPLFHDELAHWRQVEVIYQSGRLFAPNPIVDIVQYFPGLHALTAALRDLSGLSTVQTGVVLLSLLHVIALLGIFVLGECATGSAWSGSLAAFIYSLNPSFMFFDTQYAYESLAIVLFIWVLVTAIRIQQDGPAASRHGWLLIGCVLAFACVVTHHLSSYLLVGELFVIAAAAVVSTSSSGRNRAASVHLVALSAFTALAAAVWLGAVASQTVRYLVPNVTSGIQQMAAALGGGAHTRTLFEGSATPAYERVCAFLSPLIAAAAAVAGLLLLRHRGRVYETTAVMMIIGLFYFPSLPFVLTRAGNEGARRSWAFTYVGLSLLVAPVVPTFITWAARRGAVSRVVSASGAAAFMAVLLVGNVAMHINETYRFPGPYVFGSDTRSLTPELLAATRWFRSTQGSDQRIVADRYSSLAFAAFGMDWTAAASRRFPVWQLYFWPQVPSRLLLRELQISAYRYLVIDRRIARYLPRIGMYFEPNEPGAYTRTIPPPLAALSKFERLPWVTKIYQSDNLEIYRFNFAALPDSLRIWTGPLADGVQGRGQA